jgi:diadenosine tetraphosphate (Ap4A) HIT family hydrolase
MAWPENWETLTSEGGCPLCREGRPERTPHGIRVFAGDFIDAYVGTRAAQRGYVVAIWRGGHVNDLTELTALELAGYWSEVALVSTAVNRHYQPRKVNYEALGNQVPHLHTHITARFIHGDVAPGQPLPPERDGELPMALVESDAAALSALLRSPPTGGRATVTRR